jgi:cellulose biosynthesis protein BcsQ
LANFSGTAESRIRSAARNRHPEPPNSSESHNLNPKPNLEVALASAETPQAQRNSPLPNAGPISETDDLSALLSRAALETHAEFLSDPHRVRRAPGREAPSPAEPAPAASPDPPQKAQIHRGQRQWNTRYASRWSVLAGLSPDEANQPRLTLAQTLAGRVSSPMLLISSLNGGVGKTTIVATLARCLAMHHERVVLAETAEGSLLPFHFGADRPSAGELDNFVIPNSRGAVQIFNTAAMRRPGREDDRPRSDSAQHDPAAALVQAAENAGRLLLDTGAGHAGDVEAMDGVKHFALIPIVPDVASMMGVIRFETSLRPGSQSAAEFPCPWFVHKLDSSLALRRDIKNSLARRLGSRLLDVTIRHGDGCPNLSPMVPR